MKICYITDTHLGARQGSSVFREYFRRYYKDVFFPNIKKSGVDVIIHAGDFFDNQNAINKADVDYIMNEFIPLVEEYGIPMYIVVGNHDIYFRNSNEINSLSIMKGCKLIKIVQDELEIIKADDKKIVLCPWLNTTNKEKLLGVLKEHESKDSILVGHFEINNFKMYKNSILSEGGIDPTSLKNFRKVLSGHFHHSSESGNVLYLGSLFYLTWDDHNDWRGYTLYDTKSDVYEKVKNEESLFTELEYKDALSTLSSNPDDIKTICSGQFVKLYIFDEYEKIDLKDLVHNVNKFNPLSFDIIDHTILETKQEEVSESGKTNVVDKNKGILDYASDYLGSHERKLDILKKFEEIKNIAQANMKDVV